MSAREIIARAICRDPDECVFGSGWTGSNGSGFECSMRAWEQKLPAAHAAITALTAGGYRILAPGEFDMDSLEAAAGVCDVVADEHDALAIDVGSDDLTPLYRRGERAAKQAASIIRSLPVENGGGG